jgi:acetylornithine deacetylase/succinyl-diaminopimelate desuccinylase-like protein
VVLSAHLDTVFPAGTDVRVKREGTKLTGPGIGDDARGLAVLLAVARALQDAKVETPGTITFVGTVGEEGLGDLRGVKHLFQQTLKGQIDAFVSIDGAGLAITNVGVGSYRYRVTFRGPGGHSYGSFGMANPIHALGRAIAAVADFDVPEEPKTTFNVGRVGGGTSVNSIAYEAWMEVDLRSADAEALKNLNVRLHQAMNLAAEAENRRWDNRGAVSVTSQLVGSRPAGRTDESAPIVQTALAVSKGLGVETYLREGSTDANVPMELGRAAITIGGGGRGAGAHSLTEEFETTRSWQGTQRALLLAVALAQVHPSRVQ